MADLMGSSLSPAADAALLRSANGSYAGALRSRAVLDQLRAGSRGTDPAATRQALRQASQEFEAVFVNQLVTAMRKTVGDGGLIEKSQGEKIFEGMLDEEWARSLASRSGHGSLSELIYTQLSRQLGLEPEDHATLARGSASPGADQGHPLLMPSTALPPAGLFTTPAGEPER